MSGNSVEGQPSGRPDIRRVKTGADLKQWYWRKDELVAASRAHGLPVGGAKFELLDRLALFLDTGALPKRPSFPKAQSRFDWHSAQLSPDTKITDNYRNTQNVRRFFLEHVGSSFKFNIAFMEWLKSNEGKNLADACTAYRKIGADDTPTRIKDHYQFNQYTRDFLADNPDAHMDDVRRVWAQKIKLPSETGRHRYHRDDLSMIGHEHRAKT